MAGEKQENTNSGPGQAVNVQIGMGPTAIIIAFLVVVILAMLWSTKSASEAKDRALAAEKAATTYATELRQTQFWIMRASSVCAASGINMPPIPASLKN